MDVTPDPPARAALGQRDRGRRAWVRPTPAPCLSVRSEAWGWTHGPGAGEGPVQPGSLWADNHGAPF